MTYFHRRDVLKFGLAGAMTPALGPLLDQSAAAADPVDPYADARLVPGEPPMPQKGAFTIAVLPDTQNYSERFPEQYLAQTRWIVQSRRDRNIAAVLHLGDITNNNAPAEWENAAKAMNQLDGHLPYFMVPGNHDYSDGGVCKDRTTRLNDYFPAKKFRDLPTFGGCFDREPDRLENSFHLFSAGDRDFLVIGLEFGPRADVVRWANEVAAKYRDRAAILITHAYMYYDETRYDWSKYGDKQSWNPHGYPVAKATSDDLSDGEELWQKLVSKHENFVLTLNGHVLNDGLGRTVSVTPAGRDVHQTLVNFQM
jgi:3',5'-cyclic AMP phosphodiesterase CpdA